jgi:hypothetical protein
VQESVNGCLTKNDLTNEVNPQYAQTIDERSVVPTDATDKSYLIADRVCGHITSGGDHGSAQLITAFCGSVRF